MKLHTTTALEVAGLVLITVGIALVSVPAAFVFAGAALIGISYLKVTRRGGRK